LYESKYVETFCEEKDPGHFSREFESEEECLKTMKSEYNGATWSKLGDWKKAGRIPQHYILPKYKDIVAD
jgi:hypothetical protein